LATLSVQALQHVQRLDRTSVEAVAARLYAWNRLPTSSWRRVREEPALIARTAATAAGKSWTQVTPGPPSDPWCFWRPRVEPAKATGRCWKLYVSPGPLQLAEAVSAAFAACAGLPVISLKYGLDADGILRPDKLVVHLADAEAMHALGERLLRSLDGCVPHGVPFTPEIGGDGLISWGIDPPAGSAAARGAPSWRLWVTRLLARALNRNDQPAVEPWQGALHELERAGVDSQTWAPADDLWASDSKTGAQQA
jgi:hypothetical protein